MAQSVTLYYTDGGASDKEYTVRLDPEGAGYTVRCFYGRRGGTQAEAIKTKSPVSLAAAQKVYDAAVTAKVAKGYTAGAAGTPYQGALNGRGAAVQVANVLPQLLNEVDPATAARLIADDGWYLQPKYDGHRRLVRIDASGIAAINRRGLVCAMPQCIVDDVRRLNLTDSVLDGEQVGDHLFLFDVHSMNGIDLRDAPYFERLDALCVAVLAVPGLTAIELVETAIARTDKLALVERLEATRAEGFVLKNCTAPYQPGRPNVGGPQIKIKFWKSASVLVAGPNGDKSSVAIAVLKDGEPIAVGHVTIPPNKMLPPTGAVCDVRYLYFNEGGALYQTIYLGERDDIEPSACTIEQLVRKGQP